MSGRTEGGAKDRDGTAYAAPSYYLADVMA
jgi:hypothetical protein